MAGANSGNSGGKLFISYSRKNKGQVYPFADALVEAGIDIWIDRAEIDPLDDFPDRIRDGLARSHVLLAWYSPEYAQSSYCQKELTAAWICTQRLTRDVLSRILIVNPEEGVAHIALGDVGRQNYLAAPNDEASLSKFIQSIRDKLAGLSGDFAALREFKTPDWHPSSQPGSSRFVGRLQELWRIHTALNPVGISNHENPGVIVQLTGLGGIGKSLLAIEYAKRFGAAYPGGIHWLRAYGFDPGQPMATEARERERQRQIEDIAICHDLEIKDKSSHAIYRELGQKLAAGRPYLWIVDDLPPGADQRQGLSAWCAPSINGLTLITTRCQDYAGTGNTVPIDVLDPETAFALLTQVRKPRTDQEQESAQNLVKDLGSHALAIDVAGYFLLKTIDFASLRDQLAKTDSDPLGKLVAGLNGQLPGGHEKSIVATLLSSIQRLGEEGLNLLRLTCELHGGTPTPLRLAKGVFAKAFKLDEQAAEIYLARAANQVEIHSLATIDLDGASSDAFSVHALVRYTLLHSDPAEHNALLLRQQLREGAVLALVDLLHDVTDIRTHTKLELEVAHARHLVPEPRTEAEAALSTQLGHFAGERGNYREALAIARKALRIFMDRLGADHPWALYIRNDIAAWTGQMGDAREALRLFRELLTDQTRVLGEDNPLTLATRNNIAHWTGQTGDVCTALRLCQELLPDQTRVLGANDPLTLATRSNIARWTGQTGDVCTALRLCQELLPDQTRVLGPEHRETLTTRNNIAAWTGQMGDAREALQLFLELLTDRVRVFGPDHPETLITRSNIAASTGETGDAREALRLCQELLPDQTRVLGADHPETLITRSNIAAWTGEKHDALRLFQELLRDRERVLGADHPDTLITRASIAHWTGKTGDARKALRLFRELLTDQTRVLGANHPDTINTREWIQSLESQEHGHPIEARHSSIEPHRHANSKIGRNEPCPCGSGLKYKRCHGKNR